MRLIAHRGNFDGPNPDKENEPVYIMQALAMGYDVEIDVWYLNGTYYLGHDTPQYAVDKQFLMNPKFWCHAKNINALYVMESEDIHCFMHDVDSAVFTSLAYIWTYPGQPLTPNSICVLPETNDDFPRNVAGICSDYISRYESYNK